MMLARFRFFTFASRIFPLFAAWAIACSAVAYDQAIVATDLLQVREVTAIDVSRDGSRAVYAVKSIAEIPNAEFREEVRGAASRPADSPSTTRTQWEYRSHLFMIDLADAQAKPRQLTSGARHDTSPRFSPDGRFIAFVRSTPSATNHDARQRESSVGQIWILPVDGGEAWQFTDMPEGCDSAQWSPDGLRVLVASSVKFGDLKDSPAWPSERPRREWRDAEIPGDLQPSPDGNREQLRAWLEDNAEQQNPVVITRSDFQDELALRGEMMFRHLYVIDVFSAEPRQPPMGTDRIKRLTSGHYDHLQASFTADGTAVLYAAKKPTDRHPDRVLATDLWRVNVDGSNDRRILAIDGWSLESPKPSRDGTVIAFLGTRIDEPAFRQTQLGMVTLTGDTASDPVWMTDESTSPYSISTFEWMPLTPGILFTSAHRGGFPLLTISPGLLQPAAIIDEVDGLPIGVRAFAAGGGAAVFSVTSSTNPCVLQVRDGRGIRTLHDLNEWVQDKKLSLPAKSEITRPDGTKVDMWLMEPTTREVGKKYPLCLQMHGGPSAMWGPGEFTMWHEFQMMCARGFGVVYCNPRGSGGYGYAFQRANFQNWGEGPGGDVLAAVDQALMKDWVDADRLVITGGSYAGYLTAWVVAHDHRFKAAVAQRGVYHLDTFFGEGNAWRLVQWAFGGNPYESRVRDIIHRHSPFTHVTKIRTPLLIMHSSNDLRTGVSQSEMLYRALKDLNKPVEYVRYPHAGHDLSRTGDPRQRMDRLLRILEFFERYVENPRALPPQR